MAHKDLQFEIGPRTRAVGFLKEGETATTVAIALGTAAPYGRMRIGRGDHFSLPDEMGELKKFILLTHQQDGRSIIAYRRPPSWLPVPPARCPPWERIRLDISEQVGENCLVLILKEDG